MLRSALNPRISEKIIGLGVSRKDYDTAVARYREIAIDLETSLTAKRYADPYRNHNDNARDPQATARDKDGDTPMTGVNKLGSKGKKKSSAKRAVWVSREVLKERY
ncbi:uncharacterized protein UV8b_02805 [Ustilaginoidea virens]|uniref:Uncharacterized protein n=1 Tax=Ustilaginoidea virens TaxID=1159556 RepID=A0A8E5HNE8_USTVR|nr:uncharacterized protein UV8b_02805 [Ustilaginoidea virens]QUC18564.1 hypothetical protein UV8b_02805 [Ustilaginoidea virens]